MYNMFTKPITFDTCTLLEKAYRYRGMIDDVREARVLNCVYKLAENHYAVVIGVCSDSYDGKPVLPLTVELNVSDTGEIKYKTAWLNIGPNSRDCVDLKCVHGVHNGVSKRIMETLCEALIQAQREDDELLLSQSKI